MFFPPFFVLAESTFQKLNGICSVQAFPRYWYMYFNVKKNYKLLRKIYFMHTHTLWRAKIVANEAFATGGTMRGQQKEKWIEFGAVLNFKLSWGRQLAIFVVNYSFQIFKFGGFLNSSLFVCKNFSNLLRSFESNSENMLFSSLLLEWHFYRLT